MTKTFKFILLFISSLNVLSAQVPDFFWENIEMRVFETYCHLKGEYYFKNAQSVKISTQLFYPFVISKDLLFPDSICVIDSVNNRNIEYRISENGIYFNIEVPPKSVVLYVVNYFQSILSSKMEYILTTTQKWNKPLQLAEYRVYLPDKNWIITWRKK